MTSKVKVAQETESRRLDFVQAIVTEAVKANPSTDVHSLTLSLLFDLGIVDAPGPVAITVPKESQETLAAMFGKAEDIKPLPVVAQFITAPFPTAAISGDEYDMFKAVEILPEFDELPDKFEEGFSVIRTDSQTVVMNSVHYTDLITLRNGLADLKQSQNLIEAVKFMSDANAEFYLQIKLTDESTYTTNGSCKVFADAVKDLHAGLVAGQSDQWLQAGL